MASPEDMNPKLDDKGIKRVQGIIRGILFIGQAFNNKLLVALSAIGSQQAAATTKIAAVEHLHNYVATHPNDGLLFWASDMILAAHSDAGSNNESKGRNRAGSHIFLSENLPIPPMNGAVLTIAQIV